MESSWPGLPRPFRYTEFRPLRCTIRHSDRAEYCARAPEQVEAGRPGVASAFGFALSSASRRSSWSGSSSAHRPELAVALLARISSRHEHAHDPGRAADPRQQARQRRAVSRHVLLAMPPPGDLERRPVARSWISAIVWPTHGLRRTGRATGAAERRCHRAMAVSVERGCCGSPMPDGWRWPDDGRWAAELSRCDGRTGRHRHGIVGATAAAKGTKPG
jgi:hypothetical protein